MTATQEYDLATLNHTYILPAPTETKPASADPPDPAGASESPSGEFAGAIDEYRRRNNRPFPTWSEVLEVLRGLGYTKRPDLALPRRNRVQINRVGRAAEHVRAILTRLGGVPLPAPPDGQFGFHGQTERDRALDAVRAEEGWTSVEPR
jgi:hypothetical protein